MPGECIQFQWLAGLGNPGLEYAATRHNAGYWFVDALARDLGVALRVERRLFVCGGKASVGGRTVHLIKPITFMNNSGKAIHAYGHFYKLVPEKLLVVHDDLDLPAGVVRLKRSGGHGGHNGLRDIIAQFGHGNFWRLRVGIGHPGEKRAVTGHVLKPATLDDQSRIDMALDLALDEALTIIEGDINVATQRLHSHKPEI